MRLSMWVLADWLKCYNPQIKIQDGRRTLRNVRLYSENQRMDASTVYLGAASDFIDGMSNQIICAQQHDLLILDAEDINEILNEILNAFDFYNAWSDTLREKLKTEYSLQDMLADSWPIFNCPLFLGDPSFYVYAYYGIEEQIVKHPTVAAVISDHIMTLDQIIDLNQDRRIRSNNPQSYLIELSDACNAVRNLFFRGQHRGWLVTSRFDRQISRGEMDVQDELGDIVERWMEIHQDQEELVEKSGVFQQILTGRCVKGEDVYRRIESFNWRRNDAKYVYVMQRDDETVVMKNALDRKIEQAGAVFCLHFEDNLLFIVNSSLLDIAAFEKELNFLLERASCHCGRSALFTDIFILRKSYEQALIAVDCGRKPTKRIIGFEDAALRYCFSLIVKNEPVSPAHPALMILRAYDEKHHTQLYQTLEAYLQCERNYVKTAAAITIHRSTLLYRIERIRLLTGLDLESADIRLHILMSYQLERFAKNS